MTDDEAIEMDEEERDDFLGDGGTGVIALSKPDDEAPYAVPVSYGYDDTEAVFYFRLAVGADSEKGDLAERAVTFVTYGQREDAWRSVVASGRLRSTTDESVAIQSLEGFQEVQIPLVDIFGEPTTDVPFEFYRLEPDELTTRRESPAGY